jgi:hypothetical protein
MANPELQALGISSLRALLLEQHKDWQIAEKRLRRIRQDILAGLQTCTTEHGTRSMYVHKDMEKRLHIDSDGVEYQILLDLGVWAETGRKFRKDMLTGEWVPAN